MQILVLLSVAVTLLFQALVLRTQRATLIGHFPQGQPLHHHHYFLSFLVPLQGKPQEQLQGVPLVNYHQEKGRLGMQIRIVRSI
jgi:hypothetical protein